MFCFLQFIKQMDGKVALVLQKPIKNCESPWVCGNRASSYCPTRVQQTQKFPLCVGGRIDGIVAHISRGSIFPQQLDGIREGEINIFRASEICEHIGCRRRPYLWDTTSGTNLLEMALCARRSHWLIPRCDEHGAFRAIAEKEISEESLMWWWWRHCKRSFCLY